MLIRAAVNIPVALWLIAGAAPVLAQFDFPRTDINFDFDPWPTSVGAGDLNADGFLDLAVTGRNPEGVVLILMGNESGGFDPPATLEFSRHSDWVSVAHFDTDPHLDLAVALRRGPSRVAILKGLGDGTFAPPLEQPVGREPSHLLPADFDGDGDIDLAVSNYNSESVTFLLNQGDATFSTGQTVHLGQITRGTATAFYLASADLDGDLDIDVAAAMSSGFIAVIENLGNATFAPPVNHRVGTPTGIAAGDVDGDGDVDLVYADLDTAGASALAILQNQGGGVFEGITRIFSGNWVWYVTLADLNGDQRPEAIMTDALNGAVFLYENESVDAPAFNFSATLLVGGFPRAVLPYDIEEDCDVDLVVANISTQQVQILVNETPQDPPCRSAARVAGAMRAHAAAVVPRRGLGPRLEGFKPADTDGNGRVDSQDVAMLMGRWPWDGWAGLECTVR